MIYGIGTDIVEIARINAAIEKSGDRFLDRIYTENEKLLQVVQINHVFMH